MTLDDLELYYKFKSNFLRISRDFADFVRSNSYKNEDKYCLSDNVVNN